MSEWRQCLCKRKYLTEKEAMRKLKCYRMDRRLRKSGKTRLLNVYPCSYCGNYHIGHMTENQPRLGL